jgi:hypothetical protein
MKKSLTNQKERDEKYGNLSRQIVTWYHALTFSSEQNKCYVTQCFSCMFTNGSSLCPFNIPASC